MFDPSHPRLPEFPSPDPEATWIFGSWSPLKLTAAEAYARGRLIFEMTPDNSIWNLGFTQDFLRVRAFLRLNPGAKIEDPKDTRVRNQGVPNLRIIETYFRAWSDLTDSGIQPNVRTYIYPLLMRFQQVWPGNRRAILAQVKRLPGPQREAALIAKCREIVTIPGAPGGPTSAAETYGSEDAKVSADEISVRLELRQSDQPVRVLALTSDEAVVLARQLLEGVEGSRALFEARFRADE